MRALSRALTASLLFFALLTLALSQAGRRPRPADGGSILLNVVATREDDASARITGKQISLYDGGIEQTIKSFSPDPSPARIVLLVDNSLTIRADVEKLEEAAREFAYEIYEGDQLLVVGYDEQAEIVADWTDDSKQIEASLKNFRKKGDPHLFDALSAVAQEALLPLRAANQKRIIVVISDGLDRGSKTKFERILAELQSQDITVYAVQAQDRTGGALRRDRPKPVQVIAKLAEGTGGRVFSIKEPREAAKAICDELRKNRYLLSYAPSNVSYGDTRRLLIVADSGIQVRSKTLQPPN
ncbi:MAG TPA: VWA domain-containing protein [Pyrinomonadaceae bacterium]|nr:VWA domain-containing protein [Pyrinomonadaceae bacterium]